MAYRHRMGQEICVSTMVATKDSISVRVTFHDEANSPCNFSDKLPHTLLTPCIRIRRWQPSSNLSSASLEQTLTLTSKPLRANLKSKHFSANTSVQTLQFKPFSTHFRANTSANPEAKPCSKPCSKP